MCFTESYVISVAKRSFAFFFVDKLILTEVNTEYFPQSFLLESKAERAI